MNEPAFSWTDARTDLLKALWPDKTLSASIIAERLGAPSRGSVLGKVNRLGLSRPRPPRPPKAPRVARRARFAGPVGFRSRKPAAPPPTAAAPPARHSGPAPIWIPCSILEVGATRCRWPCACDVDAPGFHFCGGPPVDGSPYCAAHTRMAYDRRGDRGRSDTVQPGLRPGARQWGAAG